MVNGESFKPDKLTVRELLTNSYNFYTIPEYQRPFKWKREQIEQIIQDMKESMDTGEYFIGSIILIKKPEGFDVIDGQQRLTTLTLILSAFYHKYKANELKKCLVDDDKNRFRIKIAPRVEQRNEFQEGFLRDILDGKEPNPNKLNIFSNYYYITKELLSENDLYDDEDKAKAYYDYILDNVSLIRIYTETEGFAVKLFYVMNTRGTSLSNDEVIKVILYDKLNDRDRETFMGSWRAIENVQKQLSDLWDSLNNLERIFTLYSYYYLGENPRTIVYDTYAKMITKGEKPLVIIDKVKQFTDSLLELHREHSRVDRYIKDDRVVYPFYYLYDSVYWQVILATAINVDYSNVSDLAQELLRLYYLNWISGHNSANIKDISIKVLKLVKDNKPLSQIISLAEEKIRNEDLERQAFENLNKDVYVDKPKNWLRAVLRLIEYDLYDDSGTGYIEQVGEDSPSIDHILPEAWRSVHYWSEQWNESDANQFLYKLGNMTLISSSKNDKISNHDFKSKKRHYEGTIGDSKATRYKINDYITKLQNWNLENLQKRQEWMIDRLKNILKSP